MKLAGSFLVGAMLMVLVALALPAARTQQDDSNMSLQQKLVALKTLRDSGFLTQAKYEVKVKALTGDQAPAQSNPSVPPAAPFAWPGTRTVDIQDPAYGLPAMTLEVPAGWSYSGTILHSTGCHLAYPGLRMVVQSPDSLYQIIVLPNTKWSFIANTQFQQTAERNGCSTIGATNAADYLASVLVPRMHPDAKLLGVFAPPADVQANIDRQKQAISDMEAQVAGKFGNRPRRLSMDRAVMYIQYAENGETVIERLATTVHCFLGYLPDLSHPMRPPSIPQFDCNANNTIIFQAPMGKLTGFMAMPEFQKMMYTTQVNQDWQQRLDNDERQKSIRQMQAANASTRATMERGQIQHDAMMRQNDINQANRTLEHQAFMANQQQSTDRALTQGAYDMQARSVEARAYTNFAGDRKDYVNPANGQVVTLSNKYANTYLGAGPNGSTQFFQTDSNVDPNALPGTTTYTKVQ